MKPLNDKEALFLEYLFSDEAKGSAAKAKVMAGYSVNYPTRELVSRLEDKILEATKKYFSEVAPKAAMKIVGVLDTPSAIGNRELIVAAKDLLDRAGLSKTEKMEVSIPNGVLILPAKDTPEEEE